MILIRKKLFNILSPTFFVTGLPRSGTTWAGRAIAAATNSPAVEEPFNWKWHANVAQFHMAYLPADSSNTALIDALLSTIFTPRIPRRTMRIIRQRRLVIRDVLTCLAVEKIWDQLHPNLVILIRHPCAVANSWQQVGFEAGSRIPLLLQQPQLMDEHLQPFTSHLEQADDYFFQIGAYWGATYYVLHRLAARHPEWYMVTHETLCHQQDAAFRQLLQHFDLPMNPKGRQFLQTHNRAPRPAENAFSVARLSEKEPDKWLNQLTVAQQSAVLAGVAPFQILPVLYPDNITPL